MKVFTKLKEIFSYKNLYLFIFLVPLIINPFGYTIYELPKLAYFKIFISITLIVLIIKLFTNRKLTFIWNKYVYLFLGLWFLSLLISTIFSQAPLLSFFGSYDRIQGLLSHIFYLTFFVLTLCFFKDKNNIEKAIKFIFWIGIIISLYAILQKCGLDFYSEGSKEIFVGRPFGTLGHPNFLGQFLLFPLWTGIYLLLKTKTKKTSYILGLLIFFIALALTENRASILGFIISLTIFVILEKKIPNFFRLFIGISALTVFAGFILFFAPSIRSIQTRLLVWQNTPAVIQGHVITGSGLETFEQVFQKATPPEIYKFEALTEVADRAHNIFIDIFVTQGILGLSVFAVSLFLIIFQFFKKKNPSLILKVCFLAFLSLNISLLFGFPLTTDWIIYFTLLAIILKELIVFKDIHLKNSLLNIFSLGIFFVFILLNLFFTFLTIKADITFNLGLGEFFKGNFGKAFENAAEANLINPYQESMAYETSLMVYVILKSTNDIKQMDNAELFVEIAGNFTGHDFRYHIEMGRLKTEQGDYSAAEKHFITAYDLAPNNPVLLKSWSYMYYKTKDFNNSIRKAEEFLNISPDYWKWKNEINNKSFEEMEKYRIFFKTTPDFQEIFEYLSDSYYQLGNVEKGDYYKQFIESET
jgi:O-antigen ligase